MKSILCIVTLVAACAATVFVHVDGRCVRYADGTLARISHYAHPCTGDVYDAPTRTTWDGHGYIMFPLPA